MANHSQIELLQAESATGAAKRWQSSRGLFVLWGNFDGATARLQCSPDGSTWIDMDQDRTGNTIVPVEVPRNSDVRVLISSAGAGTSLTARLTGQAS